MKLSTFWPSRMALAACCLTTAWMPSLSQAQVAGFPITISVDATKNLAAVNPRLTGANLPWVGEGEALYANGSIEPGLFALANSLAGGPLRYPGGENADSYDWTKGVGTAANRTAMSYYPSASSNAMASEVVSFGTQEYLEYCRRLACTPVLQLNLHQGSPDEAAARAVAWLRHVNLQTLVGPTGATLPKVQYWELGNETSC
jgi:alpha-L-arabinofuranosidase